MNDAVYRKSSPGLPRIPLRRLSLHRIRINAAHFGRDGKHFLIFIFA